MHDVIIIPIENIAASILHLLAFIWGWVVAGGLFRRLLEFLAMYYAKKELDKEDPHKLVLWAQHFIEDHPGVRPSLCQQCNQS